MAKVKNATVFKAFHPHIARWFRSRFQTPSPVQRLAWPVLRRRESALLLAPTGSGKTFAAFLAAIDDLHRQAEEGGLPDTIQVLYVSPLKALGNDIHKNLLEPLKGIQRGARRGVPEIRVAVRTGDTPAAERARMIRQPPHILITTPESLYLLLGSKRIAPALNGVRSVIVDEIHALCDNKRGVHLSLSLERLDERVGGKLQRIGCSATLHPLEEIAAFLMGGDDKGRARPCAILDAGQRKKLDVQTIAPLPDFLEAGQQALWTASCELLLEEIRRHRTTLIFTNSRYKAERTALRLREMADGKVAIGVHHGSMDKELRLKAEDDLKSGRLKALVATSSLELGIDVGSIDLVCQLESPRSIATGLQRVGRAGHLLHATSKGRLLLLDRGELLEAAAICRAMLDGQLDATHMPRACLDVLAQQITGAVAERERSVKELFALIRRAHPYRDLPRERFEAVLAMLAGERPFQESHAAWPLVLWDRSTNRLSPARGASAVALMNVGTIPESAEYEVVLAARNKRVGTLQSEFVNDGLRTGDIFVLGSSTWKVLGTRRQQVLVEEAPGATPSVPWWLGPVESRTQEVGERVGRLRQQVVARMADPGLIPWLEREYRLDPRAAQAVRDYIQEQLRASGCVPDHRRLLVETWRDELGRWNLIVHCPFGMRLNRAWGLALAAAAGKRWGAWSVSATNDLFLLTLARERLDGPEPDAKKILAGVRPGTVARLLGGRALEATGFASAFRDAAACALQLLRVKEGRRVPFWLLNYRAQELFETAREHSAYPVVAEVIREQLEDRLDLSGLSRLLERIAGGQVEIAFQKCEVPSPFAHAVLAQDLHVGDPLLGRDRRARLLRLHRQVLQEVLSEEQMAHLLDRRACEQLERRLLRHSEATRARSADELAQAIRDVGDVPANLEAVAGIVEGDAAGMLAALAHAARILAVRVPEAAQDTVRLVSADLAVEYATACGIPARDILRPVLKSGALRLETLSSKAAQATLRKKRSTQAAARRAVLERYLRCRGPVTIYEVARHTGWPPRRAEALLETLAKSGKVARGVYDAQKPRPQYVHRANLAEIHRLTLSYLKKELASCGSVEVVDFLTRWQHLHPDARLQGVDGLREVIGQLQGYEILQGALESEVLPARLSDYQPEHLDRLVASGEACWCRLGTQGVRRGVLTLCLRRDLPWLSRGAPTAFDVEAEGDADIVDTIRRVRGFFRTHPVTFFDDIVSACGDEGACLRAVWYLAWAGEVSCDTYECVRHGDFQTTLSACYDLDSTPRKILDGRITTARVLRHMERRRLNPRLGRWWATPRLVPQKRGPSAQQAVAKWALQLLRRWGIVTRDVLKAEAAAPAWADLAPELKRLELTGKVSRGYFIADHAGEQYGLPEAIELLRDCRARREAEGRSGYRPDELPYVLSNRDPANLYATCLPMTDGRGEPFRSAPRRGNFTERMVVQAGQVLYCSGHVLVPLERAQLSRCIQQVQYLPNGSEAPVVIRTWNGRPLENSQAVGLLTQLGLRPDGRGCLVWPPRGRHKPLTVGEIPERFPAYYEENRQDDYGPDWFIGRTAQPLQPAMRRLLDFLLPELERRSWQVTWRMYGPSAQYQRAGRLDFWNGKSLINLHLHSYTFRDSEGKCHRVWRNLKIRGTDEVDENLLRQVTETLSQIESLYNRYRGPKTKSATPVGTQRRETMGKDTVQINRAPVLTLWGAVVAERLGYDRGAALSFGKCLSGLNAQAKGRRLGIFGPPKGPERGGPPKKFGLGEEFWVEICGRPLPAKNTADGVRAVVKDKPIEPKGVDTYLTKAFGEDLARVRQAMDTLASSFTAEELSEQAYGLYEQFRPAVARGVGGWGQKGVLDLDLIRRLGKKK